MTHHPRTSSSAVRSAVPRRSFLAALAATALTAACTSGGEQAAVTVTSTTGPGTTAPGSGTTTSGSSASAGTTASTTSSSTPEIVQPVVTTVPEAGAVDVSPVEPVTVTVADGTFTDLVMRNPEGKEVKGTLSADKRTWTSAEVLGYGREYTITGTAVGSETGADDADVAVTFTTLEPAETIYPSFFPNPELKTIGMGQPMVVIFDKAPADQAAAERALTVTSDPVQEGAWYWWDERTLHYRPKAYWKKGTELTVEAKIYGVDLGGGAYGETDRTLNVTVGPARIAEIDDATKQMVITVDGKVTDTVPVSLGMNQTTTGSDGEEISFVTPSGIYVVQEKYEVKQMSSATYGLPVDADLGYDSSIPLAVRLSNSGIFVHSAPWSVDDQGVRNVSHGCININPEAAQWFYDNFSYGDVVVVKGTSTELHPTDGYGDWNISWADWQQGSVLG
ncbi:L,D-transpeptidase family protein [Nakamurella sp. YIM 132087]|uniref:L,D-transpeptidase family protein n=1 Tax=Nakamurella alba TaxID=2665158 RepID=A0A7K1FFJ4_9ACTN|nr:Ig-like domain-containing protein [Nakamurella alba]MTD12877.1 L,D-transpeptidase family protein [Nakamurella alba]